MDRGTPITMVDRLQSAAALLLLAGLVLWVGLVLLRVIGRSSPTRRRHGRFVLGWMLAGVLIGGGCGVWGIDNRRFDIYTAEVMAWFGMLFGWVVGMIHGGVVLAVWPDKTPNQTAPHDALP